MYGQPSSFNNIIFKKYVRNLSTDFENISQDLFALFWQIFAGSAFLDPDFLKNWHSAYIE